MDREMEDSLQGRFVKLTHLYYKNTFGILKETGMHPRQAPLMILLDKKEGMSQKEISMELNISAATVAVSVKRLEKAGLLERRMDAKDQRILRIYLTPYGKDTILKSKACIKKNEEMIFQGFTESEMCLLKRFFDQMILNLSKEDSGCCMTDTGGNRIC